MTQLPSTDYEKSLALLEAALGSFDPKQPLAKLIKRVPDFGAFEWMLTIIGLEIDLRIDIPESLTDNLERTAEDFARRVSRLPKIDSAGYTLECLGLLAQALLSLDTGIDHVGQPTHDQPAHKAPASGAKAPRRQALQAKRAARAPAAATPKTNKPRKPASQAKRATRAPAAAKATPKRSRAASARR